MSCKTSINRQVQLQSICTQWFVHHCQHHTSIEPSWMAEPYLSFLMGPPYFAVSSSVLSLLLPTRWKKQLGCFSTFSCVSVDSLNASFAVNAQRNGASKCHHSRNSCTFVFCTSFLPICARVYLTMELENLDVTS